MYGDHVLRMFIVLVLNVLSYVATTEGRSGGFYAYKVKDIKGNQVALEMYKGKVSLVVNLASECGYTDSHYKQLSAVYHELAVEKQLPFTILGFPCNQFGQQEPHENDEIEKFARETYQAKFPLFAKLDVTDLTANPAFQYLAENSGKEPTWNFWKYLVDQDGLVIDAWGPRVEVETIKPIIIKAIDQAKLKHREL